MKRSVVQEWISERCSLKQQTVLLSALRGCDGVSKEDSSKQIVRSLRAVLLYSANATDAERSFMIPKEFDEAYANFIACLDHYPVHWLFHFSHAAEIVGFKHPNHGTADVWHSIYMDICSALHLGMESEEDCDLRLKDNLPE